MVIRYSVSLEYLVNLNSHSNFKFEGKISLSWVTYLKHTHPLVVLSTTMQFFSLEHCGVMPCQGEWKSQHSSSTLHETTQNIWLTFLFVPPYQILRCLFQRSSLLIHSHFFTHVISYSHLHSTSYSLGLLLSFSLSLCPVYFPLHFYLPLFYIIRKWSWLQGPIL